MTAMRLSISIEGIRHPIIVVSNCGADGHRLSIASPQSPVMQQSRQADDMIGLVRSAALSSVFT